jgi:uncharacterized membrane protein
MAGQGADVEGDTDGAEPVGFGERAGEPTSRAALVEPEPEALRDPVPPVAEVAPVRSEAFDWGGASRSLALAGVLGVSLVYFAQFTFGDDWVAEFLKGNALEMRDRMILIASGIGGLGLAALAALAALVVARRRRVPLMRIESALWFLSPIALLPLVSLALRTEAWEGRHEALLEVMVAAVLLTELFVPRALASAPRRLIGLWDAARQRIPGLVRERAPLAVVVAGVIFYTLFMSVYVLRWHTKLHTQSFDLGLHHGPLYRTVYAALPSSESLIVVQTVLLGLSAIPLFAFACHYVSRVAATLISLAYLAYYPLHGASFHQLAFISLSVFFVFASAWAAEARRHVLLAVAFSAALLMHPDVALGLLVLGAFFLLSGQRPRSGLSMAGIAAAWWLILRFFVLDDSGDLAGSYKDLIAAGTTGFPGLIDTLLINPLFWLGKIADKQRAYLVLHLLVPLAFLPARRFALWGFFVPGLVFTLLAINSKSAAAFSSHTTMHWVPYLFLAMPIALGRMGRSDSAGPRRVHAALLAVAISSFVLTLNYGAFARREKSLRSGLETVSFTLTDLERARYKTLKDLTSAIPNTARVAVSDYLTPHLPSPGRLFALREGSFDADYILVSKTELKQGQTKKHLSSALRSNTYGVVRHSGDFALLKRGHRTTANEQTLKDFRL